jgi:hypothetical protein
MNITIERGIPIPPKASREAKYPFDALDIGDSFFVEGKAAKSFGSTIQAATKRTGFKFTFRAFDDGVRVWRTE